MSDDDGNAVEMDLNQLGQYIEEAPFTDEKLHHLVFATLLPCLQYQAVRMLLFQSGGLFKKVMQGFKFYNAVQCLRLLCIIVVEKISEDQILMIVNAVFYRLKVLGALKRHEADLTAILHYAIVNALSVSVVLCIAAT